MEESIVGNIFYPKGYRKEIEEIESIINDGYDALKRESKVTKKVTFSPSSIGWGHARCARYWFYAFSGTMFNEKTERIGLANMNNGTAAHSRLEEVFKKSGRLKESEYEINNASPPIRGYADLMLDVLGEDSVGEVKTTRNEGWVYKQIHMKPSANHRIQLLIYMYVKNKRRGYFLYENKNDQRILVIPIEMDEENKKILEDVFDWLNRTHKAWTDDEIPVRPVKRKNAVVCKTCPVYDTCWSDERGEVDIELMAVPKP